MQNYFDEGISKDSIIQKEEFLLPDYLPDELLHRDSQMQVLADSLKPLLKRKSAINLFIFGPSGIGKTTCVKHILKQLNAYSSNVLFVYVNCWQNPTQLAVYNRIIEEMKLPLPRRGLAADEIFDKIIQYIRSYKKPVIIVLDDIDGLKQEELLYVLSRSNDSDVMFAILSIANNKDYVAKLDYRIRSSLQFSELEFKAYSDEQLVSILRQRAGAALIPGSYDERLLTKIAASTESGSARYAIELLWKAARHADDLDKKKITIQDFEDILDQNTSLKKELNISKEEQLILDLLQKSELESSSLYEKFIAKIPKSKRQIRNYLDLLEEKGVIVSRDAEGETGSMKSRIFSLKNSQPK